MGYQQHQTSAKAINARCAVVTLSDTRTIQTDTSGKRIAELLTAEGHSVEERRLIRDDAEGLRSVLTELLGLDEIDAILTTGGTGISGRDQAINVIESAIETPLPGFGELFRMLSFAEIGSGAMLSRAIAGIAKGKAIFAMPGSTPAVELAMTKLILPELRHILFEVGKNSPER
ncbi:MAG TPA: MogA/MoaB family molybdenum cofactor biosynthesis protein [Tepidisphaeraceae bacterium]|jgi:molybdenum cofactor biosynthesis protein B